MTGFDIWNELGNIYFKVGAFDEAIDAYNKAIELDFRIGWLYSNLGLAYTQKGKFVEAIPVYEKSIELLNDNEDKAVSWSRLGEAYCQLRQHDQALLAYQKAVELAPQNVSFSAGLSAAQQKIEPPEDVILQEDEAPTLDDQSDVIAAQELSRFVEEEPLPEAVFSLDNLTPADDAPIMEAAENDFIAVEEESLPEAVFSLDDLIPADDAPAMEDAESDFIAVEEESLPEAVFSLDNLIPADDASAVEDAKSDFIAAGAVSRLFEEEFIPDSVSSISDDFLQADDATAAEEIAPPVMEIVGEVPGPEPENAPAEVELLEAESVEEINPVPEMEMAPVVESVPQEDFAVLPEESEINADAVNALLASGIELWRKGEYEKADEILQSALETAWQAENKWLEALAHNALALVKTELGKLEEAIESYTQAMQLAPEKIIPWNNIGHLYSRLDRNDEAKTAFLKAIEHNPEDFVSWDGLGDIYAKSGRLNDSIAAYQLGNVFGKQRRAEDALTAYQLIIEPEIEEILEMPATAAWIPEIVADEPVLTDEIPEETSAEISQPVDEPAAVEEISTVTDIVVQTDVIQSDEIAVTEETTTDEILAIMTESVSEIVNEAVFVDSDNVNTVQENLEEPVENPTAADAIQSGEEPAQTVSSPQGASSPQGESAVPEPQMADELTGYENAISFTSSGHQADDVVSADQPEEEILPELAEETSVNEPAAQAQAEQDLLDSASSSIEMSRLVSAIAAYKKVTEINPENDRAWDSLGNLYRASERHSEAIAAFERAIFLRPNKEVYYYHLGLVYAAEQHFENAIEAFQKVIELNPEYTFAHCALAGYFRKLGKEDEAQKHIEKALPKMASEKEYDRACFAAICGNPEEAMELLEIALVKKQTSLDWVRRDPDLDFIRDDPRFKALISQNEGWTERLSDAFSKQLALSADK